MNHETTTMYVERITEELPDLRKELDKVHPFSNASKAIETKIEEIAETLARHKLWLKALGYDNHESWLKDFGYD